MELARIRIRTAWIRRCEKIATALGSPADMRSESPCQTMWETLDKGSSMYLGTRRVYEPLPRLPYKFPPLLRLDSIKGIVNSRGRGRSAFNCKRESSLGSRRYRIGEREETWNGTWQFSCSSFSFIIFLSITPHPGDSSVFSLQSVKRIKGTASGVFGPERNKRQRRIAWLAADVGDVER